MNRGEVSGNRNHLIVLYVADTLYASLHACLSNHISMSINDNNRATIPKVPYYVIELGLWL